MGNFFSFLFKNGKGYYLNKNTRRYAWKKIMRGELGADQIRNGISWGRRTSTHYLTDALGFLDSHDMLAELFRLDLNRFNRFTFSPLDKQLTLNKVRADFSVSEVEKFCKGLDFTTIIPQFQNKEYYNPIKDDSPRKIKKEDLRLLKGWAKTIYDGSIRWEMDRNLLVQPYSSWGEQSMERLDSVSGRRLRESHDIQTCISINRSDQASIRMAHQAYYSSFFNLSKIKNKKLKTGTKCCVDLWNRGLVPSCDCCRWESKTWRLHGYEGKIVKEIQEKYL